MIRMLKDPMKHIIAPGDEIDLFVRALPMEEKTFRVRMDGDFYYPTLGDVEAAGKTLPQLSEVLKKRLKKILWNPKFKLGLHSVAPSQVTVLGDVVRPGRIEVGPETSVLEAIALAGGLSPAADPETAVLTHEKTNQNVTLSLMDGKPVTPTLVAQGDVVYVLPGRRVNIIGEVMRPGVYALSQSHHSPEDALRMAGGGRPTAAVGRTVLLRQSIKGGILVDLSPPLKAFPPEAKELQDGDTLAIPPRQAIVFAGAPKAIPLIGGETILDVVTAAGVNGNFKDIKIIRSSELRKGSMEPEKVDLDAYLKHQDRKALVPVNDGDVVLIDIPKPGGGFLGSLMQIMYPLSFFRSFVP
jgi:protein involved in polysaccharide export with SLBB domain